MIVPVILSGGSGTRLWPLSTPAKPKQFLALTSDRSLFEETLARVSESADYSAPVVVANASHADLCLASMPASSDARLILEPIARNTAVAIVMAARVVSDVHGPDALMLVMPSDHHIGDPSAFHRAVETGSRAAGTGRLVTFGVTPRSPDTGYGYLRAGAPLPDAPGAFEVDRFVEKPPLERAEQMVADGRHFWNGGIFLFAAGAFLHEADLTASDVTTFGLRAIDAANVDGHGICIHPAEEALQDCPNISVDYAVMERSNRVAMVPLSAEWSDVGSWDALAALPAPQPAPGMVNAVLSKNCYVRSDGVKVALLGVEDLVVVANGEQVLIMRRGQSQHIRDFVAPVSAN